jgi:FtsP/CotA-like multicopper oxidase with cupredoxin domain
MSRNQRLGFLGIALAIAVAAIVAFSAGGADEQDAGPAAGTATPTATATATADGTEAQPTATPRPKPPLVTGDGVKQLTFKEGEAVRFRVRSSEAEEVHVHGYDIAKDLEPGKTVTIAFRATITGIFEVEFEHSRKQIAELKVEPR